MSKRIFLVIAGLSLVIHLLVAYSELKSVNILDLFRPLPSSQSQNSICELNLLRSMESKSIPLYPHENFKAEIEEMNKAILATSERKFFVSTSKGYIKELRVVYTSKKNKRFYFESNLARSDKDVDGPLTLTLQVVVTEANEVKTLNQKLLVDRACDKRLVETSYSNLLKQQLGHYSFTQKTAYADGETESVEDKFEIPASQEPLDNFSVELEAKRHAHSGYQYLHPVGVYKYEYTEAPSKIVSEFGQSFELTMLEGATYLSNQKIPLTYGYTADQKIELTQFKTEDVDIFSSWSLPYDIWHKLTLADSDRFLETVQFLLPNNYFKIYNSFHLESKQAPNYEYLQAYFRVTTFEGPHGRNLHVMEENESATFEATPLPIDLESNDTIQVELPEIQLVAQSIFKKVPNDRVQQIRHIIEYLSQEYTYDHEMLKNNIIRPLTTEQVLKRKKGVCQHYSVLFTSVARAMKIPTRIVMGYYLDNSLTHHAWVESEISPGLWKVIDPLHGQKSEKILTRHYLPVARARLLEDKNASAADLGMQLLKQHWIIKPVDDMPTEY